MTTSPLNFRHHPWRQSLNDELHARPPLPITAPMLVSYLALVSGAENLGQERERLKQLAEANNLALPPAGAAHCLLHTPNFILKWERHNEFSSYTFFVTPQQPARSGEVALRHVDPAWLAQLPGQLMVATHVEVLAANDHAPALVLQELLTPGEVIVASRIGGQAAWVFTDFRLDAETGFSRFTLIDESLGRLRAGRSLQRLLEIETYRLMALLAFPIAKEVGKFVARAEEELAALIDRIGQTQAAAENTTNMTNNAEESAILHDLTRLAAEVEHSIARTNFRFGASAAYYRLVQQRVNELKESHVSGLPTIRGFMERRLAPALNTCATMARRQNELSARIARTSQLLRTRVDLALEEQNQQLLTQMNRRAKIQLHLQEAVEGLSVIVLTYYGSQLVQYLAKGTKELHHLNTDVMTAISIPIIAGLVAWGTRQMHKKLANEAGGH